MVCLNFCFFEHLQRFPLFSLFSLEARENKKNCSVITELFFFCFRTTEKNIKLKKKLIKKTRWVKNKN
jgi:hypothetical protein